MNIFSKFTTYRCEDDQLRQTSRTPFSGEFEKATTQDWIEFADSELEYRIMAAILFEDSTAHYMFGPFEPYGWGLPLNINAPDKISFEYAAKIESIVFCDNPSYSKAKDTIADLRKLSRLKSLKSIEFWNHNNTCIFMIRLRLALPKVEIVGLSGFYVLESLMLKLIDPFQICWSRLFESLPRIKIFDKRISFYYPKATCSESANFFND
jgi:hypothetical protein